ncbi:MAG: potassium channel family protein, partial [Desulfobacteraceae bacterium]|nr:potassium channel family protein [Desulfobacteraceae bacterium]
MRNLKLACLILVSILTVGTLGYMGIEGCSFLDGLYMTVITITTVGFGEVFPLGPAGKVFTIGLIFVGVTFVLYVFGKVTETVVEG